MFAISVTGAALSLDTTPVFKTKFYPWAGPDDSYRPLAYARCAFQTGLGFTADLQAFERDPVRGNAEIADNSCLALAFDFFPDISDKVVYLLADPDGRCAVSADGDPLDVRVPARRYGGEDEQGWYWGVRFTLPCELLESVYGSGNIAPGDRMKGNFLKFLRAGSGAHLGATCPTSGADVLPTLAELGDFEAVAY